MTSLFKVCDKCDFEWHCKDGNDCPICKKNITGFDSIVEDGSDFDGGGFFRAAEKSPRVNRWIQGLGVILVVNLFHQIILT